MLKFSRNFLFSSVILSSFFVLQPLSVLEGNSRAASITTSVPVTPFSLSQAEIIAILKDPKLYEMLGTGQRILDIQSCQEGYLISATKSQVMVKVHYLPPPEVIGVTDFELEFIAAEELSDLN